MADENKRFADAARAHARQVLTRWQIQGKFIPETWKAAHPPDDEVAIVIAMALDDGAFTRYSCAFARAWEELAPHF